jgi:hypothetical protein
VDFSKTYTWNNQAVKILGPEDFDDYEYNYPGPGWQLIEKVKNGERSWVAEKWIKE